jgi:hypothetical protein
MTQRRRRLDLLHESFGTQHGGQLGLEDLDRNLAVVLEILGEIDRGHAARTELTLDAVPVREGSHEPRRDPAHHRLEREDGNAEPIGRFEHSRVVAGQRDLDTLTPQELE